MTQALVVVFRGGEPEAVVRITGLVSQNQHNLVADIDGEAAEHRVRLGRKGR